MIENFRSAEEDEEMPLFRTMERGERIYVSRIIRSSTTYFRAGSGQDRSFSRSKHSRPQALRDYETVQRVARNIGKK